MGIVLLFVQVHSLALIDVALACNHWGAEGTRDRESKPPAAAIQESELPRFARTGQKLET